MTEPRGYSYHPDRVTPPGATLADLLEEKQMSQADLARCTGRPQKTISEIISGKAAITPETALQLERVLGTSASFWLVREATFREYLARQAEESSLAEQGPWLRELPLAEMIRFGWVERHASTPDRVRACLNFFGMASVAAWQAHYGDLPVAFRMSRAAAQNRAAVAAWLRQGEILAAREESGAYDRARFQSTLVNLRALTRETDPRAFMPTLTSQCAAVGVSVVLLPTPRGCPASGATRWIGPDKALIQLSLRYKSNDHLWFTFFHEAAHILLHGKRMLFLEGAGIAGDEEAEANRFAEDLLIPRARRVELGTLGYKADRIEAFSADIGIAPGIVVGRLQNDGLLPRTHLNRLKIQYRWE